MVALLTMRGPEFLALFIGTSIAVYFLVFAAIAAGEPRSDGMRIRDPYMIAYLRGGLEELIRVVVLSLAIRGLLKISATGIQTADPTEIARADLPVEKAILEVCRTQVTPVVIRQNVRVWGTGQEYERHLVDHGLLADATVRKSRWFPVLIGVAFLVILAVAKIDVAPRYRALEHSFSHHRDSCRGDSPATPRSSRARHTGAAPFSARAQRPVPFAPTSPRRVVRHRGPRGDNVSSGLRCVRSARNRSKRLAQAISAALVR